MKGAFRQSMTWLHTWSGLVFCWVLYFMFLTGTLGYLDEEIDHWMEVAPPPADPVPIAQATKTAQAYLEQHAAGANRWFITPASGREAPQLSVFAQMPRPEDHEEAGPEDRNVNEQLDANTGLPLAKSERDTGGGQLLYRMHYVFHYIDRDLGYRLAGVFTMLMFVGMLTGIVVHKKIFKDFFTFRPNKGQRSWLDMHNLLSVSSLPFLIMITYSGLIFMVTVWMPGIALGTYGFDAQKLQAETSTLLGPPPTERAGTLAPLMDLAELAAAVEQEWGEGRVQSMNVEFPGDANARVTVNRFSDGLLRTDGQAIYSGVTGELIKDADTEGNKVITFAFVMLALHEGIFAGPVLRLLYVISGLIGTAMVATGAIYWTAKRRKKEHQAQSFGFRFVEAVNIGTIFGLPVAIAAYFWANRLLPLGLEHRHDWEAHVMFITWALCLIYPVLRSSRDAWRDLAWLGAFAYLAIPVLNALTTEVGLAQSIPSGDWLMAGFDLAALGTGLCFALAAWWIGRQPEPLPAPNKRQDEAASAAPVEEAQAT
ncbi:MAG: PepSY-associated TM helix domain-containing protein [Pseudomonadota bacterium]